MLNLRNSDLAFKPSLLSSDAVTLAPMKSMSLRSGRDERQPAAGLAALFLAVEVVAWVLFVSAAVPGFSGTPEPVETIALVCKAGELIGLWLAVAIGWPDQIAAWTLSVRALVWGAMSDSRAVDARRSDLPTR